MKMTVTPRFDDDMDGGYFCNKERHDSVLVTRPELHEVCYFCAASCIRHLMTVEKNSKTLQADSARTPLCQQHYEEWAAYLGLHELVVGDD